MASKREQIRRKAVELLRQQADGIRWADLVRRTHEGFADTPINTISGSLVKLAEVHASDVYKPARGLFKATVFRDLEPQTERSGEESDASASEQVREQHFYESFADWMREGLEECTNAIALGGSGLGGKWGTPDVIGISLPRGTDFYRPTPEIVSAEIKIDTNGLITAFGQACAYKLFSHRSYIVVPRSARPEDIARLDGLCGILGIGLVLFNAEDPSSPGYAVQVRAAKHEPDMFYVNEQLKTVADKLF